MQAPFPVAVQDRTLKPEGRASVIVADAGSAPLLVNEMVKVTFWPATTLGDEAEIATLKSALLAMRGGYASRSWTWPAFAIATSPSCESEPAPLMLNTATPKVSSATKSRLPERSVAMPTGACSEAALPKLPMLLSAPPTPTP